MVSGTDEHGTPVMVSADREGVTPRELADRNNALILDDYVRLGMTYDCFTRTTTRNHYAVVQDMFRTLYDEGLPHRADGARGDLARDRPYAPRPLHRGDLPDLRLRRGARRPVRQLRQPARPGRPDRPALDRGRLDARVPRDDAPVPRPARVPRAARRVDRGADALAAERPQLRAQPRAGGEAARDDPRHRLGRPRPGRGLSRGHEAHLRLVRRGDRLPLRRHRVGAQRRPARGVARVVAEPGRAQLLLHGQGQHRLPHRHLALDADGLRRRPAAPVQRRLERVPDDERQQGEHEPRSRDLGQGLPRPLRARRAALLPHRRRARDAGQRLHVGGVRPPHERRAARQLGQPRQPDARERAAKLRRGPRARPAHRGRPCAPRRGRARVRHGRRAHRERPLPRRPGGGHGDERAREPVPRRPGAVGAREDRPRPGRRPCSTSRSAPSTR